MCEKIKNPGGSEKQRELDERGKERGQQEEQGKTITSLERGQS